MELWTSFIDAIWTSTKIAYNWIAVFLDSNFSTSFFGAAGASVTILAIDRYRRKKEELALFNATCVVLIGYMNSYLSFKRQTAIPSLEEIICARKALSEGAPQINIQHFMLQYQDWGKEFLVSFEKMAVYAGQHPKALLLLMKTKESFESLRAIISYKNDLIDEIRNCSDPDNIKLPRYLGCQMPKSYTDMRLFNACQHSVDAADVFLFFANKSIRAVNVLACEVLPKRLRKRLIKSAIIDEMKNFMPSDNYLSGWEDI